MKKKFKILLAVASAVIYLAILVFSFISIDRNSHSAGDTLISFAPRFIVFTLFFILFIKDYSYSLFKN